MNTVQKRYTPQELELLHEALYEILGEIVRICQKHQIPFFVIGGTAIGALYDKAILPWDDDIDIGMKREDYNRFLEVAPKELAPQYFLSWIKTDPHTPYYFAKVKKNHTLFVEGLFRNVPMHQGIFIDIFPFDRIPDNRLLMRIQHELVKFLNCCLIGKEAWLWKYCRRCEIDNPSNRGFMGCLINYLIDELLPKKAIFRLMVGAQTFFNRRKTRYFNNIMTKTDHVTEESLNHLEPVRFGPLTLMAPQGLEDFLRYNYPKLHRFNEEEQALVADHHPEVLSFDTLAETNIPNPNDTEFHS